MPNVFDMGFTDTHSIDECIANAQDGDIFQFRNVGPAVTLADRVPGAAVSWDRESEYWQVVVANI